MKKFWTSKKFWLIIITLIGIGVFIYFVLLPRKIPNDYTLPQNEFKGDNGEPASQIKSPTKDSWQNKDFTIDILDEDLESGLSLGSCQYKILIYELDGTEYSSDWLNRECNLGINIPVGKEKMCAFEGEKACWIFVRSQDKAGNQHFPTEEKKSVSYYHVDWTKPSLGKIFIGEAEENQIYPIQMEKDTEYTFKVKVFDNFKIVGCNLYVDGKNQGMMSSTVLGCGKECVFTKNFIPKNNGGYEISVGCKDAAGNLTRSETVEAKINLPPKISSCQAIPTNGNTQTEFQFKVTAVDLDNDTLSFLWDFNDGKSSILKNPSHSYFQAGTYMPLVKVFDKKGGQDTCQTAWVRIIKK